MPTFQRCPKTVEKMAEAILAEFDTHKPLVASGAKIDFVFAFPDYDDTTGLALNDALTHNGCKALGVARKIGLKDRALGRGDAEISLDGHWWERHSEPEQRALLDHELHHLTPKIDKRGMVTDDLGRPVIVMRKHDFEVGWFHVIAERHGIASGEHKQARELMEVAGQYYWPEIAPATAKLPSRSLNQAISRFADSATAGGGSVTISTGSTSVTIDAESAKRIKRNIAAMPTA